MRHEFFLMSPDDMVRMEFLIMTIVETVLGHNRFGKPEWMQNNPLGVVAVVLEDMGGSQPRVNVIVRDSLTRTPVVKVVDGMKVEDFVRILGYRLVALFKMRNDLNVIWTESSKVTPSREALCVLFEINVGIAR